MNKEEIQQTILLARKEINQNGRLSQATKEKLLYIKENLVDDLTEPERIEFYKILQTTASVKTTSSSSQPAIRFGNARRGPNSFGMGEKAQNKKGTLLRLLKYFQKETILVVLLFLTILVVVFCQVITPRLQSAAIDAIDAGEFQKLYPYLYMMIGFFVLLSVFNLFQGFMSAVLSQRIVKRMRKDLFEKIIHLPISYFDRNSHGDIMSRMTNDVDNISNTLAQSLSSLCSGVFLILGTIIIMFVTSWQLASLSLVVILLTLIATKFLSKGMRKYFKQRQILLGRLNGTVEEMVTSYRTVCSYSKSEGIIEEFATTSKDLTRTGIVAEILGGSMGPIMNAISNVGFVIIAAFGGYFATKSIISIGVISAFIIYAKEFSRPINEIASLYGQIQTSLASAERVFLVFDNPVEVNEGSKLMNEQTGNITFTNVNFSYIPGIQVLFDFNLDIHSGEKIALVGHTGSGKTTIVNLLMRFYDIDSGQILIDGTDIK